MKKINERPQSNIRKEKLAISIKKVRIAKPWSTKNSVWIKEFSALWRNNLL